MQEWNYMKDKTLPYFLTISLTIYQYTKLKSKSFHFFPILKSFIHPY